jgi:hypothetical protein
MTKREALDKLYSMWENGEVPLNFTEEHSEHSTAVSHLMKYGYIIWEDIF